MKRLIIKSIEFLDRIDVLLSLPPEEQMKELASIKEEVEIINRHSICGQNELKWEVKKLFANLPSLT